MRMKSNTAPSGGPFSSSSSVSAESGMLGAPTIRTRPAGAQLSLDQRGQLLELRRARDAQQIEEDRFRAGQRGPGLLAQAQPHAAVCFGARDHGVLRDEHGEPAVHQISHRLEDADVRLHPHHHPLLAPAAEHVARDRLGSPAGELHLAHRLLREELAERGHRGPQALGVLLGRDHRYLQAPGGPDQAPGGVVSDHHHHGQLEAERRLVVHAVESERPIALDDEHRPVRMQELRGDGERRAHPEAPQRSWVEPAPGLAQADHLGRDRHPVPSVRHEHALSRGAGDGVQFLGEAEMVDGDLVRPLVLRLAGGLRLLLLAQAAQPGPARAALRGGRAELLEDAAGIAHDPDVDRPVAADLRPVGVDLHDPGGLRDARPVAEAEIEGRPDDHHDVRLREGVLARLGEEVRMVDREGSSAGAVQEDRRAGVLGERGELCRCVVPVDRTSRHDRRPLRARQQRPGALDERRVARLSRARAVSGRQGTVALLDSIGKHVPGDLEEHWPRAAGQHGAEGLGEIRRHAIGRGHAIGPLRDPREQVDLLHLLQRPLPRVEGRGGAAEEEDRTVRRGCVRDPGQRVGDARTGGDGADADPARQPGGCVSRVRRRLLVAGIDELDALLDAGGIDRGDVQPGEREEVPHAFRLEHPNEELRSGRGSHAVFYSALSVPTAIELVARPEALWINALKGDPAVAASDAPSKARPAPLPERSARVKWASSSPAFSVTSCAGAADEPLSAIPRTSTSCRAPLPSVALETAGARGDPSPKLVSAKLTFVGSSGRLSAAPRSCISVVATILKVIEVQGGLTQASATSSSGATAVGGSYLSPVAGFWLTATSVFGGLASAPPGPTAVSVYVVVTEGRTTTLRRGPSSRIVPVVPSVIVYLLAFPLHDRVENPPCAMSAGVAMNPLTDVVPLTRATIRTVSEAGALPGLLYTFSV